MTVATLARHKPCTEPRGGAIVRPAVLAGAGAIVAGVFLRWVFPEVELHMFARAAAWVAGVLTGSPVFRDAGVEGWVVSFPDAPVVVTTACSAMDYFLLVSGLLGFHLARRLVNPLAAACAGVAIALPVAVIVNAIRIVTVAHAHSWFIARLPTSYDAFLHMLTGAGVFLPSLIALNLLLEIHGNNRCRLRA